MGKHRDMEGRESENTGFSKDKNAARTPTGI
jgi:hypothetical protein